MWLKSKTNHRKTSRPKKPPFTYTELIEYALEDKGELTVSGIYQWISDRFPYYKSNDDRWKNSVRHNLSINPHFRKGVKAPQGAGHLWAISSGDSAENVLAWEHKKQRLDLFFKMESINRERIQQHQQQQQLQQHQQQHQQHSPQQKQHSAAQQQHMPQASSCMYDEAAVAVATLTQEMMQTNSGGGSTETSQQQQQQQQHHHHHSHQNHQNHNQHHQRLLPFNDLLSDDELRKTAGQILNGIHREVEVQSVNSIISTYHDVLLDNDYLNPIHKDVVVTESVLRQQHGTNLGGGNNNQNNQMGGNSHMGGGNSQYYITEIDPMELGIQMSHQVEPSEEEVLFSDEFNLNYFGYNPGSDIVA
uniref:RT01015p n=2 Tax=melanogaster subgroup TaxID=32351 RepID=Q9W4Q0_DROME